MESLSTVHPHVVGPQLTVSHPPQEQWVKGGGGIPQPARHLWSHQPGQHMLHELGPAGETIKAMTGQPRAGLQVAGTDDRVFGARGHKSDLICSRSFLKHQ